MYDMNWKKFMEKNMIRKERRVKIVSMSPTRPFHEVEKEINTCLINEQADDVIITKDPGNQDTWPHIIIQYTRYHQYELTEDGYKPTNIFHESVVYNAYLAQGFVFLQTSR